MSAVLVAFVVAIGAGGFGSLVGIGGGIVIVPLLTVGLGHDVRTAIAASLIGVIATSLAASPRYLRSGLVDRHLGLLLLVAATLGGLTGGITAGYLDGRLLALLFGALLTFVALQMLREVLRPSRPLVSDVDDLAAGSTSSYVEPTTGETVAYQARRLVPGTLLSFLAGNVSGLLGVGGGVINVPVMNLLMHVPIRVATTTSTFMLAATAVASSVVYLDAGRIDPLLAAPVALGVILGARLGTRMARRAPRRAPRMTPRATGAASRTCCVWPSWLWHSSWPSAWSARAWRREPAGGASARPCGIASPHQRDDDGRGPGQRCLLRPGHRP